MDIYSIVVCLQKYLVIQKRMQRYNIFSTWSNFSQKYWLRRDNLVFANNQPKSLIRNFITVVAFGRKICDNQECCAIWGQCWGLQKAFLRTLR